MTRSFRYDGPDAVFVNQPGDDEAVGMVEPGQIIDAEGALAAGLDRHPHFAEIGADGKRDRKKKGDAEESAEVGEAEPEVES